MKNNNSNAHIAAVDICSPEVNTESNEKQQQHFYSSSVKLKGITQALKICALANVIADRLISVMDTYTVFLFLFLIVSPLLCVFMYFICFCYLGEGAGIKIIH